MGWLAIVFLLTCLGQGTQGSRIGLFTLMGSSSHKEVMYGVAEALNGRGHAMTYYTVFEKPKKDVKDLREVLLKGLDYTKEQKGISFFDPQGNVDMAPFMKGFLKVMEDTCDKLLQTPEMRALSEVTEPVFDVCLVDALFQECMLPVLYKASKSIILVSTCDLIPEQRWYYNIPYPVSIMPSYLDPQPAYKMDFVERLRTLFFFVYVSLPNYYGLLDNYDKVISKRIPGLVTIDEAARKVALILASTNPAITHQTPTAPMLKSIGGIGLKEGKLDPMAQDLKDFVEGSGKEGFIYVSFGTIVPPKMMPALAKKAFFEAFSKIPQRVVWRFENVDNWEIPSNIKLVSWVPQVTLLAHPKIKAFVMHAGLNGALEAINYGVPCVVIPVFADQNLIARKISDEGMGKVLSWPSLSPSVVLNAINDVIKVPSYKENAARLQKILQDRLVSPKEEAAYWVEYVIRHNGSTHLRIETDHLNVFQYLLLDIVGLLGAIVAIVTYITYRVLKAAFCSNKKKDTDKSKKRN